MEAKALITKEIAGFILEFGMFDHLCYLTGIHVLVFWDMITEWYFMVVHHGHDMALFDVTWLFYEIIHSQ